MPVVPTKKGESPSGLLGVIGGTGLAQLPGFEISKTANFTSEYGDPSAVLRFGKYAGHDIVFLARHGDTHSIPPHKINYRANIWALKTAGVDQIIAVAAVGGIHVDAWPGRIVIPDQLIDYTDGRNSTYYHGGDGQVSHVDFSWPYSQSIRNKLLRAATKQSVNLMSAGVYGCTNGPRLETAAEIKSMERDGCDLVGMTGMPEAVLAREAAVEYACCAVVANWAAGKSDSEITMADIERNMQRGFTDLDHLLTGFMKEKNA